MAILYSGDKKNLADLVGPDPLSSEDAKEKLKEAIRLWDKDGNLQEMLENEEQISTLIEQSNSARLEYLEYLAGPGPKRKARITKTIEKIERMNVTSEYEARELASLARDQEFEISEVAKKKLKDQVGVIAADVSLCELVFKWLNDYSDEIRFLAAETLVDFSESGACVIDPERIIGELLQIEDQDIRRLAAFRAGELLQDSSVEILRPYLDDDNKDVRENIFASLNRIGTANCKPILAEYETLQRKRHQKEIAEWIVQLNDPEDAWWAAMELGDYGAEAKLAIEPLLWLIENSEKSSDRSISIGTLGRIGIMTPRVDSILQQAVIYDPEETVREAAVESLGIMHEDSAERIDVIVNALHSDPSVVVREAAVEALGHDDTPREQAIPALTHALEEDPDESIRVSAAWSLKNMISPLVVKALTNALKSGTDDVRREAADALSNAASFPDEAIPALINALSDDGYFYFQDIEYYDHVYDAATRSLYRICEPGNNYLVHARDNHNESTVRERVSEILHNLEHDCES